MVEAGSVAAGPPKVLPSALRLFLKLADQPGGVGVSARRGWHADGAGAMMCPGRVVLGGCGSA